MSNTKIIIYILFLLVFISATFANSEDDYCINYYKNTRNASFFCNNCVEVKINISHASNGNDYVVGDFFWYKIELKNIGAKNFSNLKMTVNILNPAKDYNSSRDYYIDNLPTGNSIVLEPIKNTPHETSIFYFDTAGMYTISITSPEISFYEIFPNCYYRYEPQTFPFYFEVMPKYVYDSNIRNEQIQSTNEKLQKTNTQLNTSIFILTWLLGIIAFSQLLAKPSYSWYKKFACVIVSVFIVTFLYAVSVYYFISPLF